MSKKELTIAIVINIIILLLGLLMAFVPIQGMTLIVTLLAIALLGFGIFMFTSAILSKTRDGKSSLIAGIAIIIIGILLLIFNNETAVALLVIMPIAIGIWTIVTAVTNISRSFKFKKAGASSWWIPLIVAVLYFVLGVIIIFNLASFATVSAVLLGIFLIIMGVLGLCAAGIVNSYKNKYSTPD